MLNRIYIIVGVLAIVVLAGAFIAPRFIQWGDYRSRMEELASGVLGTPVTIRGEIEFSLLPQPRLRLADVLVGSPEEPAATVDSVEAEFALLDFLRDNYRVTGLVLIAPVIDFTVDESGFFGSGVTVSADAGGVSLAQASVVDATLRLMDRRSGENFVVDDLDGDIKLTSFAGPFQFQGTGQFRDVVYGLRFNAAAVDAAGVSRVSGSVLGGGFSLTTEGALTAGMAPRFEGNMTLRQPPPEAEAADDIRGDLLFESRVSGNSDRIVLSGYTLQPDENRAGTRLTGAASIQLGARRSFDAVISGGVFALPPRDASEDSSAQAYEAVRLLSELPAPLVPPMAGRVGIDLAEVGLRGFGLRNLRVDARTDGQSWTVEQFIAELPGDAQVRASGRLDAVGGRPAFNGNFSIDTQRLDALAALWRKPDEANVLFNQPGRLEGDVLLGGDALGISRAMLTLAQGSHAVELRVGYGVEKRLDVVGHFEALGEAGSAVMAALLPDVAGEPGFGNSFPNGSFSLSGQSVRVGGLDGTQLVAEGQWSPGTIGFSRLSAADWGGASFDAALDLGGNLAAPSVSGSGRLAVRSADAPALAAIYDRLGIEQAWRDGLAGSVPADLLVDLEPADEAGQQVLTLGGALGAGDLDLRAELGAGLAGLASAPLRLTAALESDDPPGLTRQLGMGSAELVGGDTMMATAQLEGVPGEQLHGSLVLSSDNETIAYNGDLVRAEQGEIQGTGRLEVRLDDAGGLAELVGARGLSLPMAQAAADFHFEGERLARLTEIAGTSGQTGFGGEISLSRTGETAAVAGSVNIDSVSVEGLAAALFGRTALVPGAETWPDGPINVGDAERGTRGTITVSAGSVTGGERALMGATRFELTWDETRLRLARFEAAIGEGTASLDLTVCCAGPLADKTVSGRLGLSGVALQNVVSPAVAAALGGVLEAGVQFEATGASLAEMARVLAGDGSFTLTPFSVNQMAPGVFPTIDGLQDVLDSQADDLTTIIALALGQESFVAPSATGTFNIAGGVARLNNFIVAGDGAQLAGSINLALETLGLAGDFVLTPLGYEDAMGLVRSDTARIATRIGGTLLAPQVSLELGEMVAAIQVRANEMEVDRLEILQAEDAARQRAAAEERNRLIEEQRQRAAAEAARLAAEEAARLAAEQEAQRIEEERLQLELQQQQLQLQPAPNQPLNLGFQPTVIPPAAQALPGR